jgi:DNA-directed RNA polymerase specialized sigma24 family protein
MSTQAHSVHTGFLPVIASNATIAASQQANGTRCNGCGKASALCSCQMDLLFTKIFNQFFNPLINFAASLLKSRDHGREIVSDIFVRLYFRENGGKPFWDIENLEGYLHQAVRYCCKRHFRRQMSRSARFLFVDAHCMDGESYETLDLPDSRLSVEECLLIEVGRMMAKAELKELLAFASPDRAQVLSAFIDHCCDVDESATFLNIRPREVMRLVSAAVKEIQCAKGLKNVRVYPPDLQLRYVDRQKSRNSIQRKEYMRSYQSGWVASRRKQWIEENGPCKCGASEKLFVSWKEGVKPEDHGFNYKTASIWSRTEEARIEALAVCEVVCEHCLHAKLSRKRNI